MKRIYFFSLLVASLLSQNGNAQCIKDIQSLINMPTPCFFVGNIDYDNMDCFDPFSMAGWTYTWKIKNAHNGDLIATYYGIAFQHSFAKFGGYEFCLEIDKDGDPSNGADLVDCITYTTCEVCSSDSIKIDYVKCPYGDGCEINLSTKIHAMNDIGLRPEAKFVATYIPTPQEVLGGEQSYDIEFDDFDLEYDPQTDSIHISQNLTVPFRRGCFKPRVVFKLEDGYGAHSTDGVACTEIVLRSENRFRCIACANEGGNCIASELATQISNETGTCNIFTMCNLLRESDASELEANSSPKNKLISVPNPASDRLHINFPPSASDYRQLQLFNNIGQMLMNQAVPFGVESTEYEVLDLMPGVYFLTLKEDGKLISSVQVLISR